MTPAALRKFALSIAEAHEEPHFERTSFRVGKKIFATITRDGSEAMVKLPVADDAEALIASDPEVFFSYGVWTTKNGALGVRLKLVKAVVMLRLVSEAWATIAPKRAQGTSTKARKHA